MKWVGAALVVVFLMHQFLSEMPGFDTRLMAGHGRYEVVETTELTARIGNGWDLVTAVDGYLDDTDTGTLYLTKGNARIRIEYHGWGLGWLDRMTLYTAGDPELERWINGRHSGNVELLESADAFPTKDQRIFRRMKAGQR